MTEATLTPAQWRGRIGGLRLASTHDPKAYTANARQAFLSGDHSRCRVCGSPPPIPDGLNAAERQRRLDARRLEHMTRMARASVASRSRRSSAPTD